MRQVLGPGALGRPRGIGWRGRWEGELEWGIHVYPWLIHVYVWQKPLQYCKVISLQLIKKKKRISSQDREIDTITRRQVMQTPAIAYEQLCSWRLRCPFPSERRTQEVWVSSEMGGCVAEDGKIPWRRAWQPTPAFLPGESMDRGAW